MKTQNEIAMQVRKHWDNEGSRWKLWVDAGGFRTEIFYYDTTDENSYAKCIRELVSHAYQLQSI